MLGRDNHRFPSGSTYPLAKVAAKALEWCFSGRVFPAQQAPAGRLVSKVVASAELMPTARALAKEFHGKDRAGDGGADPPDDVAHAWR
jgi:enoyl-CoA hydratase/carnithine racemase